MKRPLEERDLRSLNRRSMFSIFAPLNPNERLPRELILEGKRRVGGLRRIEIAGALYLPALMLAVVVMGGAGLNGMIAFGVVGLMLVGFCAYAVAGKYR